MKTRLHHLNLRRKRAWRRCDQMTCFALTALEAELGHPI